MTKVSIWVAGRPAKLDSDKPFCKDLKAKRKVARTVAQVNRLVNTKHTTLYSLMLFIAGWAVPGSCPSDCIDYYSVMKDVCTTGYSVSGFLINHNEHGSQLKKD